MLYLASVERAPPPAAVVLPTITNSTNGELPVVGAIAIFQQLLYAFGSLSNSDRFRWSEMLLDIVKDLRSGERPSVREIAFRAGASQRRRAECFLEMSLKHIIGSR